MKKDLGNKTEIDRALTELGRQLARLDSSEIRILCGGASALCMLEILSRSTMDVDALAILGKGGTLIKIRRFPKELQTAIQRTATTLGLDDDWFNASATELLRLGLPKGVVSRSTRHRKQYGPCLTVQFLDRLDHVALKLFASMDPVKFRRHLEDLVSMKPKAKEIDHALNWMLGWKTSPAFRKRLAYILTGLEFPNHAKKVLD
jgi:hypothetical protein